MRRFGRGIALAGAIVATAAGGVLVACSSDDSAPPSSDVDGGGSDSPYVYEASVRDVFVPQGYDGGLGIPLQDVADTPCSPRGGTSVVVLGADAGATGTFRALQAAGDRWVASSTDGVTVLAFAKDGSAPVKNTSATVAAGAVTTIGSQAFLTGTANFTSVVVQALDTNGAPQGDPIKLADEDPEGMNVGSSDTAALVAWGAPDGIRARGFQPGIPGGAAAFSVAVSGHVDEPSIAVAYWDQNLFGIVFSGIDGTSHLTAFGRARISERTDDPHELFSGPVARRVLGLTKAPGGYAALFTVEDGATPYAMLMLLDVGGRPLSAGLKLVGTTEASAIALNGSELGVLAVKPQTQGGQQQLAPAFRPFSATTGEPLGPWVCVDAFGSQVDLGGGLAADGKGYAALYKASDGSTSLARFDHLGTGAP